MICCMNKLLVALCIGSHWLGFSVNVNNSFVGGVCCMPIYLLVCGSRMRMRRLKNVLVKNRVALKYRVPSVCLARTY